MIRQTLTRVPVSKFTDLNGVSTEAPEMKFVFALLDKSKARDGTRGPIQSLYTSIKAADQVADPRKHTLVKLRDTRIWRVGDHPNPMSDIIYEEAKRPVWRGA
jgi:hypothetical protein